MQRELSFAGGKRLRDCNPVQPKIIQKFFFSLQQNRGNMLLFIYKEYFKTDDNLYNEYFSADSKILVLADGDSASASECLIGCMLDYGAIGYQDICLTERDGVAKTYGKGIMQTTYLLFANGKDAVRLTTAVICWPKGNCIHGRGVLPTDGASTVQGTGYNEAEIVQAIAKWQK